MGALFYTYMEPARFAQGLSKYKLITAASTNATSIETSSCLFFGGFVCNIAAYAVFLKVYDLAAAPTVGTSVPFMTFGIQAAQSTPIYIPDYGEKFTNGFAIAVTKFLQDSDNTDVGANDLTVNLWYKKV